MAMLRWKSTEALAIYARLNDGVSAEWIEKTFDAVVDSKVAGHLPRCDADEWVAALQRAADSGELGAAARDADAATEADAETMEPASLVAARNIAKAQNLYPPGE